MNIPVALAAAELATGSTPVASAWEQKPLSSLAVGDEVRDALLYQDLPFSTIELEEYVEDVMERWHAPGVAVAIINGENTWTKGFGFASLESQTPVTPHTLFYTGSTTKSFVAAGLSLLIDNSSDYSDIQWNTPLSHLLRDDFVLSDEWATAHITIEDALCRRTGYPKHDLAVGNDTLETYNNIMFAAAGHLITKLTGFDLGAFFHKHLWTPIGMNETYLGPYDPILKSSGLSIADGYVWEASSSAFAKNTDFDRGQGDILRGDEGAGGILSNVLDYVKYLRTMMAESGPISKAGHRELKSPRTFHRMNEAMFGPGPLFYGLGWMESVFEGEQIYWHTGTVTSFATFMVMVPERENGIVVLANSGSKVRELVTYRILYDLFDVEEGKQRNFEKLFVEEEEKAAELLATCSDRLYPDTPTPPLRPSLPLASHTGQYRHPAHDSIFVSLECEGNKSEFPSTSSQCDTQDEGCHLRLTRGPKSQLQLNGNLTHKTGNFWLSYISLDFVDGVLNCLRTQFRVDASGTVAAIGIDARQEGENTPLVWFNRVK